MEHKARQKSSITLPLSIITKVDVGRLLREVTAIDDFLEQTSLRQPGTAVPLPKTTKIVDDIVTANKVNLLIEKERRELMQFLTEVRDKAPEIHFSFSAEPSMTFTSKLAAYLRENIHPLTLIQIGLQPTIGAGFMMRTTNKYYDFSLRTTLKAKHQVLLDNIRSATTASQPQADQEQAT